MADTMLAYAPQRQMLPLMSSLTDASSAPARLFEQRDRRHDLARGAIAALITVAAHERRLHRMQCIGRPQTFDRGDLAAIVQQCQAQARIHAATIYVHGAGAALAMVAAFFRAGQCDRFANAIQERRPRIDP